MVTPTYRVNELLRKPACGERNGLSDEKVNHQCVPQVLENERRGIRSGGGTGACVYIRNQ